MRKAPIYLALAFLAGCGTARIVPPVSTAIAEVFSGFDITDRGILGFGVPVIRSGSTYGPNKQTALDVTPRGAPAENAKAWIDVCDADIIANANVPIRCLYLGETANGAEIGARSFNGASQQPLRLKIGDAVIGELNASGLVIYGTVTARAFVPGSN